MFLISFIRHKCIHLESSCFNSVVFILSSLSPDKKWLASLSLSFQYLLYEHNWGQILSSISCPLLYTVAWLYMLFWTLVPITALLSAECDLTYPHPYLHLQGFWRCRPPPCLKKMYVRTGFPLYLFATWEATRTQPQLLSFQPPEPQEWNTY